ncbi:GtrA family protein [Nocardioides ferulae]|uniref:GtrA family protein n=1 Tax=Nocardioides ferulae TaxID=2340821 RepID=UPI000EAE4ABC|nr:GtrA family protein [Nocardioides ferulae]
MTERQRRLLGEAGRFLAVGGVATVVALVLFNALVHGFNTGDRALLDGQPYLAYIVANSVGMLVSYAGSRRYAFRHRPPQQADGGLTAFVGINVVTMTLPIACLWVSRNLLELDDPLSDNIAANVIGLVLGLGARFYLFRTFVFKRPIHLTEMYDDPSEVVPGPGESADAGPVSEPTDRSRSSRVPPPAP